MAHNWAPMLSNKQLVSCCQVRGRQASNYCTTNAKDVKPSSQIIESLPMNVKGFFAVLLAESSFSFKSFPQSQVALKHISIMMWNTQSIFIRQE